MAEKEAWITSAVEDDAVHKAMTLAVSLRRVHTARKLVCLTSLAVSKDVRETMKSLFDLILYIEPYSANAWSLEDLAKIQGFSLQVFKKCVYISPNALALQNCDEIFGKYTTFAARFIGESEDIDSSIYLFTPNLIIHDALRKGANFPRKEEISFSKHFNAIIQHQVPSFEILDGQYNFKMDRNGYDHGLISNVSIFNFDEFHPLNFPEQILGRVNREMLTMEKFAMEQCWNIFLGDLRKSSLDLTGMTIHKYKTEPIAIVGLSFRLPGANNVDEFWSLLSKGKEAVGRLPSKRWTKEQSYYHCNNRNIQGGFLDLQLDQFDSKFFGLSPKEAEFLDPQQKLLMEVTWEALEDAMIDPLKLKGTQTGVFVGSWVHDYKDMLYLSKDFDFFRTYMGSSIATTAARISHFLGTTGPSIATESACSSAISAMDMACKSLRNANCSMALASSVNVLLHPFETSIMDFVLSPDYRCKTFDANANGYVRAEGCAVLLLKRLSDAVRDGDNMWGLIRGSALAQEGISKSMGTPTVHCESMAMELALRDGDVEPKDVSYIEAHGTGTAVGDPMEIQAIAKVYSDARSEPLLIGSVKTNIGHTESVSGMAGIIKVLLAMENEVIPKHLNLNTLNPKIDLSAIPAQIPVMPVPWPRRVGKRRTAGVSSFGISGTDGHVIIEEPLQVVHSGIKFHKERPLHILKLSTKSKESMDELIQKYLNIINDKIKTKDDETNFPSLAYSANVGRATFNHRAVIIANNFTDAAKALEEKSLKQSVVESSTSTLCFLFTGQGSQYPNMAKQLYNTSLVFRDNFNRCDSFLQRKYNIYIGSVVWVDSGNSNELSRTLYSQTSIFVVEFCLLKLWESWGVKPDYVMGHSLGEFAAAVAAGALDLEDALMLVAERSRLIDQLPRGKMLVLKADKETVEKEISEFQKIKPNFWVDFAAINSSMQTVVAGDPEMVEQFSEFCRKKSLKTVVLAATHAFHSRNMDSMLETYGGIASTVRKRSVKSGGPKYVSGMLGKLIDVESIDATYWVRHTRDKVRYMDACRVIEEEGCTLFLEVGPHPVLSALMMLNSKRNQITCFPSLRRNEDEWVTLLDTLANIYLSDWKGEIDWKGFDKFYTRTKLRIPFYPFNRKGVWKRVETKYPKIHPLLGRIIPTALSETIFQNSLALRKTKFVQDHVIGNTVIFPGAGFLEMCLVGGHSVVQGLSEDLVKPRRPIFLKSLNIATPLALDESMVCKIQTLITLNDQDEEIGYSVAVHQLVDDVKGKWVQHATAKFIPMSCSPTHLEPIDVDAIQLNTIKLDTKDFYNTLPTLGLRFGPQFQSLESVWNSGKGFLASVKVPQDYDKYLIHPIVADAMIQAVMLWTPKYKTSRKLQVPVQISEFAWLREPKSPIQFIYCPNKATGENETFSILVDEAGIPLAYMKGIDFMETTVKHIEGIVTQQSTAMPKLWEDVWKNSGGPMHGYLIHENKIPEHAFENELKFNNISEQEQKFYKNIVKLTRFSILKSLYFLGWKPKKSKTFSVESVIGSLNIQRKFQEYVQYFLRSLAKDDCQLLRAVDSEETKFKFTVPPPTMEELEEGIKYVISRSNDFKAREDFKLILELEANLSLILTGKVDPRSILFPKDPTKPSVKTFYECETTSISTRFIKHLESAENRYISSSRTSLRPPVYRVLEVGARSGAFAEKIMQNILPRSTSTEIEYFFTDIEPTSLLKEVGEKLKKYNVSIVVQKYDMNEDPLEQGLCPGYFDLILANQVFHFAKDIRETMKNVRFLLKTGGMILASETIRPEKRLIYAQGLLDGYWDIEDKEYRKHHITLTPEMWREIMTEAGFQGISINPLQNNVHAVMVAYACPMENHSLTRRKPSNNSWIIFYRQDDDFSDGLRQKLENVNRKCIYIPKSSQFTEAAIKKCMEKAVALASEDGCKLEGVIYLWSLSPETRDQAQVSLPFVTLMQIISGLKSPPKTFAVMRGVCAMESSEVTDPTPGTLVGFCKSLANENPEVFARSLDLDPNKEAIDQLDEVFMNIWVDHKQGAAFRDGLRLSPKLAEGKISNDEPLSLPSGCDRFQLVLPKSRLISDLEFTYLEPYTLGENEVEVEVKAMALNFRDVFAVLKPIPFFESLNSVGIDYSGVIVRTGSGTSRVRVGDRVVGMAANISLPSHYKTSENGVRPLPRGFSFAEGATFPIAYCTAIFSLINLAKVKREETVLVHTASGGVGLAAVQLCKHMGAIVIGTAGSQRKRNYLRNLGIEHVLHSRTTDFKTEILKITHGRGVDIVLNSLTGSGFKEASLDALGQNGRFIEMSKLNVWNKKEVEALRPDVFYEIVDLSGVEADELHKILETGKETIKPIPYESFEAVNIRGALNHMQMAKHIGKIVCIMPTMKLENSKIIMTTLLFNQDSTYLVTGGLGGIGYEVVKWMLSKGAKHIAIMSRSLPKPEMACEIAAWNRSGNHVKAFPVDVGDYEKVREFLEDLKKPELEFPPLRGVMHAAGVLQDAVLANQSWDKFFQTYNPKVKGSWNLHDLTKDYILEHFVLFSSIAATFGNPGQTNHSASNAFEDSLAAFRRCNGLPATCVNWGNWGEVGVATEIDFPGIRPITSSQGLLALETFLKTQTSHMSVLNVDSFSLVQKLFPQVKHYVHDIGLLGDAKANLIVSNDEFWSEVDSKNNPQEKQECFKTLIKTVVRNILKIEKNESIDDQSDFQSLGIDSLMVLEMKNGMQNILGQRMTLTINQLNDFNTPHMLAKALVDVLEGEQVTTEQIYPSHTELKQLIRDDSALLPDNISIGNMREVKMGEVGIVLLTGVTGNLGPYLLRELTKRKQVKTVYCLIRPTKTSSGMDRLTKKLCESQLDGEIDIAKVQILEGDITDEYFGLDVDLYFSLSKKVEAIIHSAVKSDHTAKYWKAPETNKSHTRTVNVLGTVRLLEFATIGKLKHFFHSSTMLAFTGTGEGGQFTEGWQDVSAFDNSEFISLAYVLSKHISEQIVHRALMRGVPCKAFRFPVIAGDSKTGRLNYQQNHAILRWLSFMKIGMVHDLSAPISVVPVDHCAKISLDIFFNPEAPTDIYNILQKTLDVEQCLVDVAKVFGIQMQIVPYGRLIEKVQLEAEKLPISPFVNMYAEYEYEFRTMLEKPSIPFLYEYNKRGSTILCTSKLVKYCPGYETLEENAKDILIRDFSFLKREGVLKTYTIY